MLTLFEPGRLNGMARLTETADHQARSDRILGRCMVTPVAIDTCHPGLTHWAFLPGRNEARVELLMAIDTDSIVLLGG